VLSEQILTCQKSVFVGEGPSKAQAFHRRGHD
jgi:hypothetical protein